MAIYGVGSNWDGDEMKVSFFENEQFVLGWDYVNGKDLYAAVSLLKAGDILYLKANAIGSRDIRVKGIGVVTKPFIHCLVEQNLTKESIVDWNSFFIKVKWVFKSEFKITIPEAEGKLTNIRTATFYEEHLPAVQDQIINKLFN